MIEFSVGDPVTKWYGYGRDRSFQAGFTVKSIGKLKLTLSDGSEWRTRDQREWGGESYHGYFLRPSNVAEEKKVTESKEFERRMNSLRGFAWHHAPQSTIDSVYKIVFPDPVA